jgi:chromosome transmission fidelity protein 8
MNSTVIPISIEDESTNGRDWILVELQGELRARDGEVAEWKEKRLGKLLNRHGDNPVLIIGSSKLEGKRVKLNKPFAILKRCGGGGYESRGVVTEKFVFKTRPKPLTLGVNN